MHESTSALSSLLGWLTDEARRLELTDTAWAARAGIRKETLSRLRRRGTCDFGTVEALAKVVGARLGVVQSPAVEVTADRHFPVALSRQYEERLVQLCASGILEPSRWAAMGPLFFMSGLAVMVASVPNFDRRGLLALAEELHPGASDPAVFSLWLERSPVRPSRFLPLLEHEKAHAA